MTSHSLKYRADIDGLRALAVLGVLFFHGGSRLFSGGFVGVDIFFVISGFLITSIINRQVEEGSFKYREFWLKRIRRIFPASFFCIAVSMVVFYFLLSPSDLIIFGKSLVAMGLFASNVFFWRETGYFSPNAEEFPLLHTWSLSIEEQFYFFLPIVLLVLERLIKNRKLLALSLMVLVSFIACLFIGQTRPTASFYLLPTRAWELGLGSLIALMPKGKFDSLFKRRALLHLLTGIALGLMIVPMLLFSKETPFPSFYAAFPVLGASLFIALPSGDYGFKKPFSHPLTLLIGKISYSLYLWHWVVFVALKHISFHHPTGSQFFIAGLLSLFLATLSYLFIEEPFRRNLYFWNAKKLWIFFGINFLVFVGVGVTFIQTSGMPKRFGTDFVDYKKQTKIPQPKEYCQSEDQGICLANKIETKEELLLWGDSHAQSYLNVFKEIAKAKNITLKFAVKSACPVLLGIKISGRTKEWNDSCQKHNREVIDYIKRNKPKVFIAFRYDLYFNGRRDYERSFMTERYLISETNKESSKVSSLINLKSGFKAVLDVIPNQSIHFLRQVPAFNYYPAAILNKLQILGGAFKFSEKRSYLAKRVFGFEFILEDMKGLNYIDTWQAFCDEESCSTMSDFGRGGVLLYYDDDHLNVNGSRRLSEAIRKTFK